MFSEQQQYLNWGRQRNVISFISKTTSYKSNQSGHYGRFFYFAVESEHKLSHEALQSVSSVCFLFHDFCGQ